MGNWMRLSNSLYFSSDQPPFLTRFHPVAIYLRFLLSFFLPILENWAFDTHINSSAKMSNVAFRTIGNAA